MESLIIELPAAPAPVNLLFTNRIKKAFWR